MSDATPFGGIHDRCGQPYLQRDFPRDCRCPSFLRGAAKATERRASLERTHLQPSVLTKSEQRL